LSGTSGGRPRRGGVGGLCESRSGVEGADRNAFVQRLDHREPRLDRRFGSRSTARGEARNDSPTVAGGAFSVHQPELLEPVESGAHGGSTVPEVGSESANSFGPCSEQVTHDLDVFCLEAGWLGREQAVDPIEPSLDFGQQ
jgi:hypothetical protein